MSVPPAMPTTRIPPVGRCHGVLGLGCWAFGGAQWGGQDDGDSIQAMQAALEWGMNHFDTAEGYGRGHSEEVVGRFLAGRRDEVFLATKGFLGADNFDMTDKVEASRRRLGTDWIDLYYIHWPRKGRDMRPAMASLARAQAAGKIGAIGVSNFSVEQMEQVSEAGPIAAHQLCYNLFWRFPEREVIGYCAEHGIAVVTYSSIAQGILTGKFPRQVTFPAGDQRPSTVLFRPDVWPHVYEGVEELKSLAAETGRPLTDLAIRWVARRRAVTSVLVGARGAAQVRLNAAAMSGEVPDGVFDRMTEVGDRVMRHVPDEGNIFGIDP